MAGSYPNRFVPFIREVQHDPPERTGILDPRSGSAVRADADWDDELCDRCNGLRLDSFFTDVAYGMHQPRDHEGILVSNLGHHDDWSEMCTLCSVFRYATKRLRAGPGYYMLRLLTRRLADLNLKNVHADYITELDRPLLAVTPDVEKDDCHVGDLGPGLEISGYVAWRWPVDAGLPHGQGKLVDAKSADLSLVSTWLQFCQEHHTELCIIPTRDPVRGFQLIDCQAGAKLVPGTRAMQYVALSYCWGANTSADALVNGKLLWGRLPQTVRDAVEVTKKLGFRYLWVDRYCIPSDPQIKHSQINKMNVIYAQAQATILATAGDGADHGLPGVGRCARIEQPTATIGKHTVFPTLTDPRLVVGGSKWNTRGWTFQEAMLSTRRIFFTSEQVYWECRSMQCTEALPPQLADWHDPSMETFYPQAENEIFSLSTHNLTLFDVWKYIALYSTRKLSYDGDSLNGFLGVLGYLRTPLTTVRHLWGMPIPMRADHRSVFGAWHPQHCLLNALTWAPEVEYRPVRHVRARRRPEFPSWSWVGWESALPSTGITHCYQGCTCNFDEPNTPTITGAWTTAVAPAAATAAIATTPASASSNPTAPAAGPAARPVFLSWDALQELLADRDTPIASMPRVLVVQAHTVQLTLTHMHRGPVVQHTGYYAYNRVGDAQVNNMHLRDCVAYKAVDLTDRSAELEQRIQRGGDGCRVTGVLLGCYRREREAFVLLLDRRADGVYERIGTAAIKSLPTFNGVLARVTGSVGITGSGEGRISTCPSSVTLEDWKLQKTWKALRIK